MHILMSGVRNEFYVTQDLMYTIWIEQCSKCGKYKIGIESQIPSVLHHDLLCFPSIIWYIAICYRTRTRILYAHTMKTGLTYSMRMVDIMLIMNIILAIYSIGLFCQKAVVFNKTWESSSTIEFFIMQEEIT